MGADEREGPPEREGDPDTPARDAARDGGPADAPDGTAGSAQGTAGGSGGTAGGADVPAAGWPDGLVLPGPHVFELGTDGPKVLVVGIDGSETSVRAAAYATGLARRQNSYLVFLYVQSLGGPFTSTPGSAVLMASTQGELAREFAVGIRAYMEELGKSDWEFRTVRGDVYTELAGTADDVRADGVVVGASTQAGHRIAGSVAVRLVRAGRWPVTVVP